MHIRRAGTDDAGLISRLSEVTFFDTFNGTCTDEDMQGFIQQFFNEKQVGEELQDATDFYFIVFVDEIAAGYIRMKEDESEVPVIKNKKGIELKRLYVLCLETEILTNRFRGLRDRYNGRIFFCELL